MGETTGNNERPDLFSKENIEQTLAIYDEREKEMDRQLAQLKEQATTARGKRVYADVKRAFDRERQQMQVRRDLLKAFLNEEKDS
jgi:hypothetical protein